MDICHYEKVDKENIVADFRDNNLHRLSLTIPLLERNTDKTICIIGQNPSKANQDIADKTLYYLERYIFEKMPQYSKIVMLNLYSRVDTKKEYKTNLENDKFNKIVDDLIEQHSDFLIVYGKLKNQGQYNFISKAKKLKVLLENKKVFKIDINTNFAPHPGNNKIYYGNFCHNVTTYDFLDIE